MSGRGNDNGNYDFDLVRMNRDGPFRRGDDTRRSENQREWGMINSSGATFHIAEKSI
jgi:hypothetical protein